MATALHCFRRGHLSETCLVAIGGLWLLCFLGGLASAEDPPHYVQKDSWRESMLASREKLMELEKERAAGAGLPTVVSPIVRGGEPARRLVVPLHGVEELNLYVTGAPDVTYGAATWAGAKLIGADGRATWLEEAEPDFVQGRHEINRNMYAGVYGPLAISGRGFEHGIHVYAYSRVRVLLDGKFERLETWIGIDDWVGPNGAVRFHVADSRGAARLDLWKLLEWDFPEAAPRRQMRWEQEDRILEEDWRPGDWRELARRYAEACRRVPPVKRKATELAAQVVDEEGLRKVQQLYDHSRTLDEALTRARQFDFRPLRMAIDDLIATFGDEYPRGKTYAARLDEFEEALRGATSRVQGGDLADYEEVLQVVSELDQLRRAALLANPLLDFDRMLVIRRTPHGDPRRPNGRGYGVAEYIGLPRQSSKCNPMIEQPFSWDNEIAVMEGIRSEPKLKTLFQSDGGRLITDVDLHWDAERLLFSMPGTHDQWQLFEMNLDGRKPRQLTPTDQPDIHHYDGCYLPNNDIVFASTAPLQGVPCNTQVIVGMLYAMDANGDHIRQLCFEQDHDYNPVVMNDGRVLYLRWDYTDTPHVWNRQLFTMNPDGTGQMEYYGSSSYWPNSIFFARPIPHDPGKFIGIVTGHHVGRVGELILFDPAQGRRETEGVVQRIPGYGQEVKPLIQDKLTEHSWPKFTHPYPLCNKYFLVSAKPRSDSLWGIYLVDVFDNMVLIHEEERQALLEPLPLHKTRRPPVIPNRVTPAVDHGLVYIEDIYSGRALDGVPRGIVKDLRVFTYHFAYQTLAGITHRVGTDGPWEVKRVLGTVPVEEDGSAFFKVPAKTPISVQPLDEEGKAIQLMRSWMTAMPGETLSCIGCHDKRHDGPLNRDTLALARPPRDLQPWYGPSRGFSFRREVQPVLDEHCVGCHNGRPWKDGSTIPDLRADQDAQVVFHGGDWYHVPQQTVIRNTSKEELIDRYNAVFEPSYLALRRLVRVPGLESDLHELPPMEFHADTSELVQMLQKGHHNVQLDEEAWDRLVTWIDLNAPCHGTWSELAEIPGDQRQRRRELRRLYGGVAMDGEDIPELPLPEVEPVMPEPSPPVTVEPVSSPDWPFDAKTAQARQSAAGQVVRTIELADGVTLELVRIPAGQFVMGDPAGETDERPRAAVAIERPFWMARYEVTNSLYALFDPDHDSRFEHRTSWIFAEEYLGWPLNGPDQPVVRVSWEQAMNFCRWLSKETGLKFSLPTEAQWEYACRSGSDAPLWYGDQDTDFGRLANMADANIGRLALEGWRPKPPDIVPRDDRFDDGALVSAAVGSYRPNPWGLFDMHGNVAEWTRTAHRGYPYRVDDGRNDLDADGERVVRGGSWYDRPHRCRSAFRVAYPPYQRAVNVGFRVVSEDNP